jgi:ribonuclease-3
MSSVSPFRDPTELAGVLGVTIDRELLDAALTHRSFAYEHGGTHYERLEFLGDAILQQVVTIELFMRFPDLAEGDLAKRRAALVSTAALAEIARGIDLGPFIRLGNGEIATGGADKSSLLADVTESIIGAAFLSCGQAATTDLVLRLVEPLFDQADRFGNALDPKTALQETFDRLGMGKPVYDITANGPDHARTFEAVIEHDGTVLGTGSGTSKKVAEANAALAALNTLAER